MAACAELQHDSRVARPLGDPVVMLVRYGCERLGAGMDAAPLALGLSGELGPAVPAHDAQPGHDHPTRGDTHPTRTK